jgi:hypothetical protein
MKMEKLLALVSRFELVKESVKAFVAGQQAIIDGRVAEAVAAAKAGMIAELESAGQTAAAAEAKAAELLTGIETAVSELSADADEVAAAVAGNTPAAAEPTPSEGPAAAGAEAVQG